MQVGITHALAFAAADAKDNLLTAYYSLPGPVLWPCIWSCMLPCLVILPMNAHGFCNAFCREWPWILPRLAMDYAMAYSVGMDTAPCFDAGCPQN